ncbi:hypothetical protein PG985_011459 [Apiospora marii]|uniref:Uncharacterized protein n=1 Tax=Apiospora marii TaxID=335849 RepID=A0ABR1STQ3_9PEZI
MGSVSLPLQTMVSEDDNGLSSKPGFSDTSGIHGVLSDQSKTQPGKAPRNDGFGVKGDENVRQAIIDLEIQMDLIPVGRQTHQGKEVISWIRSMASRARTDEVQHGLAAVGSHP